MITADSLAELSNYILELGSRMQSYVSVPRSLWLCFPQIVLDREPLAALSTGSPLAQGTKAQSRYTLRLGQTCAWHLCFSSFFEGICHAGMEGASPDLDGCGVSAWDFIGRVAWLCRPRRSRDLFAKPPRMTSVFFLCIFRHPSPAFEFDRCPRIGR